MKTKIIAVESVLIIFLVWLLIGNKSAENNSRAIPEDKTVSQVAVTVYAPLKGYDKQQLAERGKVAEDVVMDSNKAVLATGTVKDSSGTREISAVINTKTGETEQVEHRSFSEWMISNELGIGITAGSLGIGETVEYRRTFARAWNFYLDGRVDVWRWEYGTRLDQGHKFDGMATAMVSYRW